MNASTSLSLRTRMALLLIVIAGSDILNLMLTSFPGPGVALVKRLCRPVFAFIDPALVAGALLIGLAVLTLPPLFRGFRALLEEAGPFPAIAATALLFLFPGSYTELQIFNDPVPGPSLGMILGLVRNFAAGAFLAALLVPWPAPDPAGTMPNNARAMLAELMVDLPLRRLIPVFLAITIAFQFFSLGPTPHVDDEILQDWNARLFSTGRLLPASFPCPESLKVLFSGVRLDHGPGADPTSTVPTGTVITQFPPGWSLVLAVGHLLRVPWLINPLIGALCIFFMTHLARREYGRVVSTLVGVFAATSPFLWLQASSRMNHLFTLCLFLAGMYFLSRDRQLPLRHAFFAGALALWAFATRPLDGLLIVGVLGLRLLLLCRYRLSGIRHLLAFICGAAVVFAGISWYQFQLTGSPWISTYKAIWGSFTDPGFGRPNIFTLQPHTLWGALENTWDNLSGLGVHLFGSAIPGLVLLLVALVGLRGSLGYRDPLQSLYALLGAGAIAGYFLHFYQDFCFGPRFLFLFLPAGILLAARGLARLADLDAGSGTVRAPRILLIHLVFTILVTMPSIGSLFLHSRYWRAEPVPLSEQSACPPAPALIFVKSELLWLGRVMAKFAALGVSSPVIVECRMQQADWHQLDLELENWAVASTPADPDRWARDLTARFPGPQTAHEPDSPTDFKLGEVFRANPVDLASAPRRFALDLGPTWNARLRRALPGHRAWMASRNEAGIWFDPLP